ncbi:MAG: hypothetical protein O7H41_11515 [Planctomycetota bacterium]|nr:hypothetical protein [Planctomycetota bacterium]
MTDAPYCPTCGEKMGRVGTAILNQAESLPLYRCDGYRERGCEKMPKTMDPVRQAKILGVIVNGQAFRMEDGDLVPVAHPDDVWG